MFGGVRHKNVTQWDRGTGRETYGLGNVCGKGHVIAEDRIETAGAGIDVVMDHVIVMVVTYSPNTSQYIDS